MLIPPLTSPDHPIQVSAPTLYVASAPRGATPDDSRDVARLLDDATPTIHADGSPHSWVVLPAGWVAMGGTQIRPPAQLAGRVAAMRPAGWALVVLVDG